MKFEMFMNIINQFQFVFMADIEIFKHFKKIIHIN
jgi:hypothetical protein